MTEREPSRCLDLLNFKDWRRCDWLGAVAVGLLLAPPIGFLLALIWLVYESYLVVRSAAIAIRNELRRFGEGVTRLRRHVTRKVRDWFTPGPPAPPRPPTAAERAAAAKRRFEEKRRLLAAAKLDELELTAAQEQAKQQYLRELDEVMK